jgi:predicted NUDIX family phosphoesterase
MVMSSERMVFGVPRDTLIQSGIIPPEKDILGKAIYLPITGFRDLSRFVKTAHAKAELGGGYYRERAAAEYDPGFQQISMYGFVMRSGRLMTYQRGHANEEPRLDRSRVAIGVGGHMELDDTNSIQSFYREIAEELEVFKDRQRVQISNGSGIDIKHFKQLVTLTPVGIIKDERDEVGRMHTGVAIRIEPKTPDVDIRVCMDNGQSSVPVSFIDPRELFSLAQSGQIRLEGWGEIVLEQEILPKLPPA